LGIFILAVTLSTRFRKVATEKSLSTISGLNFILSKCRFLSNQIKILLRTLCIKAPSSREKHRLCQSAARIFASADFALLDEDAIFVQSGRFTETAIDRPAYLNEPGALDEWLR
jgi:hypothetical protein